MKRTQAHEVLPGLLELNVLTDNLHNIGRLPYLLFGIREIHGLSA
jgi:hypothetical protein